MQWKWQRMGAQIAAGGTSAERVYARMGREIAAAGYRNPDPVANDALAAAIERARGYGMSEAMIAGAIDAATGAGGVAATRLRLEGYGRDGIAFVIDVLTDDAARTERELGTLLAGYGARLEQMDHVTQHNAALVAEAAAAADAMQAQAQQLSAIVGAFKVAQAARMPAAARFALPA